MKIKKRNGLLEEFDESKIINAVKKATIEVVGKPLDDLSKLVSTIVTPQCYDEIDVESIQDLVIKTLLGLGKIDIATHYIGYRATQEYKRNIALQRLYDKMGDVIEYGDNENANKNYKMQSVIRDTIAGEYFRDKVFSRLPKDIAEAHKTKAIHWHDSDVDTKYTNCFVRDTKFITDKGVKSFLDFEHNDKIRVLTHNGVYKNAVVKHYGKQLVNEVIFKRGKLEYKVKCTENHRWILKNENITTSLKIGDKLFHTKDYFNLFDINKATQRQKYLWCRGFILGDGNTVNQKGKDYTRLRICGHKKELSHIFEECGYKINKNNYTKTDYTMYCSGDLKRIPYEMLITEDDIIAYVSGLLYADGGIGLNSNGTKYRSIYAKNKEVQEFIEKYFPTAGVYISKINDLTNKPSNFKRNGNPKEYILLTKIPNIRTYSTTVVNINKNVSLEEVWCLEVEDDHSFVLPNGICTGNCCLINIEDMLNNGTRINNADIETPHSVGTAMNIAMQIMASVSSNQYGGISLPNFNEVFSKYAKMNFRKNFIKVYSANIGKNISIEEFERDTKLRITSDNETLENGNLHKIFEMAKEWTAKDIYDACQLFEYQTNSVLGSASQTPFSTITFNIPTSWESEQIISSYLDVRMKGLGEKGITAIFPKLSMIVVDGYNLREKDPYYWLLEKASKCIAKTYYPDILNYSKEDYDAGKYYARMGCRSRVNHEYQENGKYQQYGRFNYGVVTLNLPQIALKSLRKSEVVSERIDEFFNILNTFGYNIMKKSMLQRYEFVKVLKAKEAPILFQYGAIARLNPEDTIERLLKSDRASVSYGFLGIDDCVRILTDDKENISTKIGKTLGLEIMKTVREQANRIKKETELPVSVYGSPVEASIYNMWKEDRKNFDDVMPQWLKDREYYTNSFHFSSELPIDSFDKIELESKFIDYCNGGNISYVENSGKAINNMAIIELIQHSHECGTQYFAVNTITDVCYVCGYTGEITYNEETATYKCPHCGNTDGREMKVQRRCCGYISNYSITHGVKGRMKEINHRAKHF